MDAIKELKEGMDAVKDIKDGMLARDERLATAEGQIVHLGGKTRDLEKDFSSMDQRLRDQEATLANQAVVIETQRLRMEEMEKRIEMSGGCDRLYRLVGDLDRRQQQLERQIAPADLQKSSCYLFIHNLSIPKGITLRELLQGTDPASAKTVRDSLVSGLGENCTKFITMRDSAGRYLNIAEILPCPEQRNYRHPQAVPAHCRNSLLLRCSNRLQTVSLEAEIRKSLISSSQQRKNTDLAYIEAGLYSPSHKIRSLHRHLLWRGRTYIDNLDGMFDQYRVLYRGGLRANQPGATYMTLELRASKKLINEIRPDLFLDQAGDICRSSWTDFKNLHFAQPESTWFPPRVQAVSWVASKLTRPSVNPNARPTSPNLTCEKRGCDQVFRSQTALKAHMEKDHTNKRATKSNNPAAEAEQDIHRLSESETEEDEESSDQHNTIETVINVDNVPEDAEVAGEDPTFSPRSQMNRRAKKAAKKNIDQTDTVDAAETTEPIPPSTKKALKVPAPKTNKKSGNPPAGSTPSFKQQKLNFTGAQTPSSSAPPSILNMI